MTRSDQSLTHRTISGLLWLSGGKVAYGVIQLAVLAVLGRLLTPADFGVLSAALVVIAFAGIASQLGLGPAVVQRPQLEPRHIHTALTGSVLLGLLLGAVIWVSAPLAASFFHSQQVTPVLRGLAVVFPLQGLGTVAESLARRELQFRWLARLDVMTYTAGYGFVALPMALAGFGVWSLVMGQVTGVVVRSLLLLRRFRPPLGHLPERRALAELMYFGGGFTLAKIANFFATRGDNMMVGHLLGPAALGIYGRAYQLMSAPASGFGTILDQVLFASMARVQTETRRVATAFRRGVSVMALIVLPTTGAAVILAPEIIRVLLGPQWDGVVDPFRVLALGMLLQNNSKIGDSLARALGAVYRRAWRQILYALLVVAGAYLGQRWGVVGVAWGVLLAIGVNFALMTHLSLRLTGMGWLDLSKAHLPGLRIAVLTWLLLWGSVTALRSWVSSPFLIVVASLGATAACSAAIVWLWPRLFLGPDGLWMVERLRAFLPARSRTSRTPPKVVPSYQPEHTGGAP